MLGFTFSVGDTTCVAYHGDTREREREETSIS